MSDDRTATIFIHESILFKLLGMECLCANIVSSEAKQYGIEIKIKGNDDRIPEGLDYPDSVVIQKHIQGYIKKNSGV